MHPWACGETVTEGFAVDKAGAEQGRQEDVEVVV